jgi:hydrogenase/urease accessory protein HupE
MEWTVKTWLATLAALGAALLPTIAHAHPGPHEGETAGLLHAVTEPDHLLALLLIGAGVLWAPRMARRVVTPFRRHGRAAAARALFTPGRE